jgi:uncharacterized membrane protein HdeD (DUF308 family)
MSAAHLWKWIGGQGLLTLSFGVLALVWPGITAGGLLVFLIAFGIGSAVFGVAMAWRRQDVFVLAATVAFGLGAVGLALFGVFVPGYAILVCLIAVLLQALGGGLALIGYGLWQRGHGGNGWPALAAGGLVTLVGVGVWFLPPAAPSEVMERIGGYALAQGTLLCGAGLLLRLSGRARSTPASATQAG